MDSDHVITTPSATRLTLFEDRYGLGAHERLLELLRQPCVSFAEIASRFGVTRERVRQWHQQLMPSAPSGLTRRRLCRQWRGRQQLTKDPLFRGFVHHLRDRLSGYRLTPIPTRVGYRKRVVRVNGQLVVLKRARARRVVASAAPVYLLPGAPRNASFVYFDLPSGDFLFIPRSALPEHADTFVDTGGATYAVYKNVFTSLRDGDSTPAE